MGAVTEDAFCLKWNDFHTSVTSSFAELRDESDLLDATVVCEGQTLRAHKLVLSACSGVFRQLFRSSSLALGLNSSDHPVILLWDVKADDLRLLFNFMYEGQVNVAQERLSTFLALAERLQVRGLTSTTGDGTLNRSAAVAAAAASAATAVKSIVPLVPPSIPIMGATTNVMNRRGQRLLTHGSLNKRARTSTSIDHRDGNLSSAVVKQERHIDGETPVYEGVAATNSIHPGGFQHGQPTAVSFGGYYEGNPAESNDNTARHGEGEAPEHDTTGFTTDGTAAGISHPPQGFELQPSLIAEKGNLVVGPGGAVGGVSAAAAAAAEAAAAAAAAGQAGGQTVEMAQLSVAQPSHSPAAINNTGGGTSSGRSPQNHSGVCQVCNKTFRQLRTHIMDVHNPTPTPCPLCGKIFSSKHKMFGHKYRSCPNRTRNLVKHLQDIDGPGTTNDQSHQQAQQQTHHSHHQQQQQSPF